jgi:hypothetical protein
MSDVNGVTKPLAEWLESLRAKKQTMKTCEIKELRVKAVLNKAQAETLLRMKRQKGRWQPLKEVRHKPAEIISAQIQLRKYYPVSGIKGHMEKQRV